MFGDFNTDENYTGGFLTGAHLTFRETDRYLFGAFAGGGKVFFASTDDDAYTQWLVGVEGQAYFGNMTLFGQAGISGVESNVSTSHNVIDEAFFLRGVARQYMNYGDTKLEGELGWASGVNDNGLPGTTTDDVDVFWWGGEVEHAVTSFGDDSFLSVFGRYDGYYAHETIAGSDDEMAIAHVFMAGVRIDLNRANPLARERSGVAVDMPNMTRINGNSRLID